MKDCTIYLLVIFFLVKQSESNLLSCESICDCTKGVVSCPDRDLDNIPQDLDWEITKLDLHHNRIKYISSIQFYPSLETLDVSNNDVSQIKRNSFTESQELMVLNLDHNKLGSVTNQSLEGLVRLGTLLLSNNEIEDIEPGAFVHCKQLHILNLSSNKLPTLKTYMVKGLEDSLIELHLSNNYLSRVPTEAIAKLRHLDKLYLNGNPLSVLKNSDFNGINPNLDSLDLSDCGLYAISQNSFLGLGRLKYLNLEDNGLHELPNEAFKHLFDLETLKVGRNKLRTLDQNDLLYLPNLETFSMDGCHSDRFNILPGAFGQNSQLKSVLIKCLHMTSISEDVSLHHLQELSQLSFHGSGLTTLPKHLVNYPDLTTLDLGSNPLHCDCHLKFLYALESVEVLGSCDTPELIEGRLLSDINHEDLQCDEVLNDESTDFTYVYIIAGVGLFIFFLIIAIVLRLYWTKKGWNLSIMFHRKDNRPKKRLSRTFTGDKKDIVVLQQDSIGADSDRFLPLKGLNYVDPEYQNLDLNSNQSEHLYSDIAEVTETVPKYNIPIGNVQCPDVKVSMI